MVGARGARCYPWDLLHCTATDHRPVGFFTPDSDTFLQEFAVTRSPKPHNWKWDDKAETEFSVDFLKNIGLPDGLPGTALPPNRERPDPFRAFRAYSDGS